MEPTTHFGESFEVERWCPILAWACGLLGCQATTAWPAPAIDGTVGLLFAVQRDGTIVEAHALNSDQPLPAVVQRGEESEAEIWIGLYEVPLDQVGVIPGPLTLPSDPEPSGPLPSRALKLGPPYDAWTESDQLGPFERMQIPRYAGFCAPYEGYRRVETVIPESSGGGQLYTAYARFGSMFVGNAVGLWEVGGDSASRKLGGTDTPTTAPANLATQPFVAAHWDAQIGGSHWFYQADGHLWRSDLGHYELAAIHPATQGATRAWMAGSDEHSAFELYIMDEHGLVYRYDDTGFRPWRVPAQAEALGDRGGLIWVAPGEVWALGEGGRVLRLRDSEASDITPSEVTRATSLSQARGVGVFMGDEAGHAWRSANGRWERLNAPALPPVWAVGAFGQGYLYGGKGGRLRYYQDGLPGCHEPIDPPATVFRISGLYGGEILLFSSPHYDGPPGPITVTALIPTAR